MKEGNELGCDIVRFIFFQGLKLEIFFSACFLIIAMLKNNNNSMNGMSWKGY